MILQKLAQAIREQNWFTVVIEMLIVVTGIFVGLQVDGLNQMRQDRIEERRMLGALDVDIADAISTRADVFENLQNQANNLVEAMEIIQGESGALSQGQCQAVWLSHLMLMNYSNRLASFDEMISSGLLRLLRNTELRRSLVAFHNQVEGNQRNIDFVENDVINIVDHYPDLLPRYWSEEEKSSFVLCDLPLIRKTQRVRNNLLSNLARRQALAGIVQRQIEALRHIQAIVADERSGRSGSTE